MPLMVLHVVSCGTPDTTPVLSCLFPHFTKLWQCCSSKNARANDSQCRNKTCKPWTHPRHSPQSEHLATLNMQQTGGTIKTAKSKQLLVLAEREDQQEHRHRARGRHAGHLCPAETLSLTAGFKQPAARR